MEKHSDKFLRNLRKAPHSINSDTLKQFWEAVCKDYQVSFSCPMPIETKRQLLSKVLIDKEPLRVKYADIANMTDSVLWGELQSLAAKHFFPVRLSKSSGRPNKDEKRLRSFALLAEAQEAANGTYHWNKKAAQYILKTNPDLKPKQQLHSKNTSENALLSQYRTERARIEKQEKARLEYLQDRIHAFWAKRTVKERAWLVRLEELWKEIPDKCNGDTEQQSEMVAEWKSLAAYVLPEDALQEYIQLFLPAVECHIIVGRHYQVEAEKARKPFERN